MRQAAQAKGNLLTEYHRATPECPNPEMWHMYDSMTAEYEVLEFLRTLVTTLKPKQIVETGAFLGKSTIWMAEGLRDNQYGQIVSCELDPVVFEEAKRNVQASDVAGWISLKNVSSLEMVVDGPIDILFSDSDPSVREEEVRHFLPQMNPHGIILMHDASSHKPVVRDAAKKMQAEGLISVVFLPTPRGLVIAQKLSK